MANESKEIHDIAKKSKILLLDIEGTTTSISFVKDKLFPYVENNVKQFLETEWETNDVKEAVTALRNLALEDEKSSLEGLIAIPGEDASKEDQIEGLVKNVKWQMSSDRKAGPLKHLQGLIWKQAFDKGEIKGHVYDDVSAALEQWHGVEGQKVYIYSSGSVQAQKLLFNKSLAGDLLPFIDGHFDTSIGAKQDVASYNTIVEKIGCKPDEILFLTDIVKEAEAARSAGMHAALVSREGNAPLDADATAAFAVIHSFSQLAPAASNKRKTEPQDEQPAKIPKTDTSNDVKDVNKDKGDTEIMKETPVKKQTESEPEKMEVEEEKTNNKAEENKVSNVPSVVVEELTDSNKTNVPASDVEAVVTKGNDKQKEVEKMETESIEAVEFSNNKTVCENTLEAPNEEKDISAQPVVETESPDLPKEQPVEEKVPVAEETPPDVVEIEEITPDKENLIDMADIVDDKKPIVEEPVDEMIENMQNVGKELEKECEDILNIVNNVKKQLDNISVKQSLHSIEELPELVIEVTKAENANTESITGSSPKNESDTGKDVSQSENDKTENIDKTVQSKETEVPEQKSECGDDKPAITEVKSDIIATESVEQMEPEKAKTESDTKEATESIEVKAESINNKTDSIDKPEEISPVVSNSEAKLEESSTATKPEAPMTESSPKIDTMETVEQTKADIETQNESNDENTKSKEDNTKTDDKTTDVEEPRVNGKTNGEAEAVDQNGDASEDLSSRLSAENGKEVNGSNGDSMDAENGSDDKKEVEIKVKTVTTDETRTEPIEQPAQA